VERTLAAVIAVRDRYYGMESHAALQEGDFCRGSFTVVRYNRLIII